MATNIPQKTKLIAFIPFYYLITPIGYCIVTQCSEPCCFIKARQSTPTISCLGKAICNTSLACISFSGWLYVGYNTASFIIRKLAYVAGSGGRMLSWKL